MPLRRVITYDDLRRMQGASQGSESKTKLLRKWFLRDENSKKFILQAKKSHDETEESKTVKYLK